MSRPERGGETADGVGDEAVLLAGHGSRRERSNEQVREIGRAHV